MANYSSKQPSLKDPIVIFLSFFGVGFTPRAPGTAGSVAILPILYLTGQLKLPFVIFIPFILMLTIGSCFIAEIAQKKYQVHDPGWIVIDEVLGMSVAWLFIQHHSLLHLLILFVLFRFFDIIKFWPATFFDKKVVHGSGTILDDIVSGIYSGIIYFLLYRFAPAHEFASLKSFIIARINSGLA